MKQFSNFLLLTLIFGLVLYSCDQKKNSKTESDELKALEFNLSDAKAKILEMNKTFTEAHINGKKDSLIMVNYYTQDAKIFL